MGKTSSAVKSRYNAKTYDQLSIWVPKGVKGVFREVCEANGESMGSVLLAAIKNYLGNAYPAEPNTKN